MDLLNLLVGNLVVLAGLLYVYLRRRHGKLEHLGIPIVPSFLCFGSPPFSYHKNITHEHYVKMHKKFGKTWCRYSGVTPTIVTIDPDIIKEVMVKQFDSFVDGFEMDAPDEQMTLDASRGEIWRSLRKILSPTFTSGKLKSMLEPIDEVADNLVKHLEKLANDKNVNVKPIYQTFTLETIARCAFGIQTGGHSQQENEILNYGRQIFNDMVCKDWKMDILVQLFFLFPGILKFFSIFGDASAKLFRITQSIMKERDEKKIVVGDFIDRLREIAKYPPEMLNRTIITAQGIIFFAAGFETTSNTLSTLTYNLAIHPEVQEMIYEEIQNVLEKHDDVINHETIGEMVLLEAALSENLRMYGPITENDRLCTKDCVVNGLHIKKGTIVQMPTWASHHNPEFFPDPETFKPERFLKENSDNIIPYTWRPFGGGPRNCIGKRFAIVEMMIAMAKIIKRFRIERTEETKLELKKGNLFFIGFDQVNVRFVPREN